MPKWLHRRRVSLPLAISVITLMVLAQAAEGPPESKNWLPSQPVPKVTAPKPNPTCQAAGDPDPLLGPRTKQPGRWIGHQAVRHNLPIVVMAGHADSQQLASAGTPGFAVDVKRQPPMDPSMRDELFWNFRVQNAVCASDGKQGSTSAATAPILTIRNDNDPRTNWSQAELSRAGLRPRNPFRCLPSPWLRIQAHSSHQSPPTSGRRTCEPSVAFHATFVGASVAQGGASAFLRSECWNHPWKTN